MIPPFRRNFDAARDPVTAQNALAIGPISAWTPTLTFATPGDLTVVYATRVGTLITIGKLQIINFAIQTSTFTHTTAAGNLTVTGFKTASSPFNGMPFNGPLNFFRGITKANYTQFCAQITSANPNITFVGSGSGQVPSAVAVADVPTGGTVVLRGQIIHQGA